MPDWPVGRSDQAFTTLSICCGASTTVAGRTTKHYECTGCGNACDAVPDESADWDPVNQAWEARDGQ